MAVLCSRYRFTENLSGFQFRLSCDLTFNDLSTVRKPDTLAACVTCMLSKLQDRPGPVTGPPKVERQRNTPLNDWAV